MREIDFKRVFTRITFCIIALFFHFKCISVYQETVGTSAALGGFFEMFILAVISSILGFIVLLITGWSKANWIDYVLFFFTTPIPVLIITSVLNYC